MHTHTTAGMAVACKAGGLQHDDFYGAELFGDVAYHAFEGITVRDDEGPRLVASLGDKRVLILRNHGLLVVGSDVFNAFRWMWTLQRACEVQVAADSIAGPNVGLSDAVRRASAQDAHDFEPRDRLERMLFTSVLRRARVEAEALACRFSRPRRLAARLRAIGHSGARRNPECAAAGSRPSPG